VDALQDLPLTYDFSDDPINLKPETLRFKIENVRLYQPLDLSNVTMYCVSTDGGSRGGYRMLINCNMDRYPKNMRHDGEWILALRCPSVQQKGTLSTFPDRLSDRCDKTPGVDIGTRVPGKPH